MSANEPTAVPEDDEPNDSWFARNVLWVLPLVFLLPLAFFVFVCGLPVFLLLAEAEDHEPLKGIMAALRASPEVRAKLGEPIRATSLTPFGQITPTGERSAQGQLRFSIKGSKEPASVYVELAMQNDVWTHRRLDVRTRDAVIYLGEDKSPRPDAWNVGAAAATGASAAGTGAEATTSPAGTGVAP